MAVAVHVRAIHFLPDPIPPFRDRVSTREPAVVLRPSTADRRLRVRDTVIPELYQVRVPIRVVPHRAIATITTRTPIPTVQAGTADRATVAVDRHGAVDHAMEAVAVVAVQAVADARAVTDNHV